MSGLVSLIPGRAHPPCLYPLLLAAGLPVPGDVIILPHNSGLFHMNLKGGNFVIYMAFALYCEAQPFIEYWKLKKDPAFDKIQVFRRTEMDVKSGGADVALMICGVGNVPAAAAVAYVCAKLPPGPGDLFVNFGVCAGTLQMPKGQLYRIHSICEQASERWFYPDLLFGTAALSSGHGVNELSSEGGITVPPSENGGPVAFGEASLATVPVVASTMEGLPCDLAEMEAAGMYQAAQMFFEQHRIVFFKVVYDQPDGPATPAASKTEPAGTDAALKPAAMPADGPAAPAAAKMEPTRTGAAAVRELCQGFAAPLCDWLEQINSELRRKLSETQVAFSQEDLLSEEAFAKELRATAAMRAQLHQMLYYRKLMGESAETVVKNFCESSGFVECNSKKEGMAWLNRLRESLWI